VVLNVNTIQQLYSECSKDELKDCRFFQHSKFKRHRTAEVSAGFLSIQLRIVYALPYTILSIKMSNIIPFL